jgi:hypothetical protein
MMIILLKTEYFNLAGKKRDRIVPYIDKHLWDFFQANHNPLLNKCKLPETSKLQLTVRILLDGAEQTSKMSFLRFFHGSKHVLEPIRIAGYCM